MKQKKENRVALLLHWAGGQKIWLFLAILLSMCSGLCIIVPYIGIYRLMDATFNNACTKEPVSYTHLDVYKRQVLCRNRWALCICF